jgi:hypothetical protein
MRIKDDSGVFPIALLIYAIMGVVGIFFFIFFIKQIIYFVIVLAVVFVLVMVARGSLKAPGKMTPYLVVGIIGVLIALAIGSSLIFTQSHIEWEPTMELDTNTKGYLIGYPAETEWFGNYELDDIEYITSWMIDEESQRVGTAVSYVVKEDFEKTGASCVEIQWFWYEVYLITNQNQDWVLISDNNEIIKESIGPLGLANKKPAPLGRAAQENLKVGETMNFDPISFKLRGQLVGGIKVELWVNINAYNCIFGHSARRENHLASEDIAYLKGGIGFADVTGVINKDGTVVNGGTTAEEGGKVIIHVECGAGEWELRIGKTKTLETSYDRIPLSEGCWQDVHWDVPDGAFKPSSDPLENQWTAKLLNTVIEQSSDTFFTVDKREYIPDSDDISIDANVNYVIVGNDVTITMTAKSNSNTNISIGSFNIWVFYGEYRPGTQFADEWIANNKIINNVARIENDTYQATYTFKAHKSGTISIELVAIDSEGRASDMEKMKINAYWSEGDVSITDRLGDWFWLVMIIIVLLVILLIYFIYRTYRRK